MAMPPNPNQDKPQFLQGWLTYISIIALLACLAAKRYLGLAVPDEVLGALVTGIVVGLKRGQNRIETTLTNAVADNAPDPVKCVMKP